MTGPTARNRGPRSPVPRRQALVRHLLTATLALGTGTAAWSQEAPAATPVVVAPSALDAPLFYQVLIGELELREGRPGSACVKGYVKLWNTEFTELPICTASREYK